MMIGSRISGMRFLRKEVLFDDCSEIIFDFPECSNPRGLSERLYQYGIFSELHLPAFSEFVVPVRHVRFETVMVTPDGLNCLFRSFDLLGGTGAD